MPSTPIDQGQSYLMEMLSKHPLYVMCFTCVAVYLFSMIAFYMR